MASEGCEEWVDLRWLLFRSVWEMLSDDGACDAWGGAEQVRVWNEYQEAGYPSRVARFIRGRANIGPNG